GVTMGIAFDEPEDQNLALLIRQAGESARERLDLHVAGHVLLGQRLLAGGLPEILDRHGWPTRPPVVGDHIPRDAEEPVLHWNVAPLESINVLPRLEEDFRGEILGKPSVRDSEKDVSIDNIFVLIVDLGEGLSISLGRALRDLPGITLRHRT